MILQKPQQGKAPARVPRLEIRIAENGNDIARCRYMIADVYNRLYGVVFSRTTVDLAAMIEPYPDRYAMGLIDGIHVASCGLYLTRTYAERFGHLEESEVERVLATAGCLEEYRQFSLREYTKVVVHPGWAGRGIGYHFFGSTHCPDFLGIDSDRPHLLVTCARSSSFAGLHDRVGIRTRVIKPFPKYKMHHRYASATDPMTTRLTIPTLDIPSPWNTTTLPCSVELQRAR